MSRVSVSLRACAALRFLTLWFCSVDGPVAAQQAQASIIGTVTDDSGSVLPGVTITTTSPALQVASIEVITNERGEYRLTPLPLGVYEVVYSLAGFQTYKRTELRLTAGFVAKE